MRGVIAVCMVLLVVACADSTAVPKDVIPKIKMEKIMWDMVQADRFVNNFIINRPDSTKDKKKEAAIFYERVFKLNGITRDEFLKSYKFYLSRPDITKVLFDSIYARADKRRAEAHRPRRMNPMLQKRDSLLRLDSIRKHDSIEKLEFKESTESMSDSALRKALFNK